MILEYLEENGPTSAEDLYVAHLDHFISLSDVADELRELRSEGRVSSSQSVPVLYSYDENFCCSNCVESFPAVKRRGFSTVCDNCHFDLYQSQEAKTRRESKPPALHDEPYCGWCRGLSHEWLRIPLIRPGASA